VLIAASGLRHFDPAPKTSALWRRGRPLRAKQSCSGGASSTHGPRTREPKDVKAGREVSLKSNGRSPALAGNAIYFRWDHGQISRRFYLSQNNRTIQTDTTTTVGADKFR
jgi:hypothetical protein